MNNIDVLNRYFLEGAAKGTIDKDIAVQVLKELNGKEQQNTDIAIIGMSCRFPGANSKDDFWQNLINGRECIYEFPNKRKMDLEDYLKRMGITENINDLYVKAGYLDEIDKFDPAFFRISPQEAKTMDPIQRLFLETAWEAIEDAGYGGNRIYGTKTGVYAGRDHSFDHIYKHMNHNMDPLNVTGSLTGILASRLAYIFDLQGPSMVIDTACSSGLVALHQACCSLKNKECEFAIAGGIHITIEPSRKQSSMGMIESSDYSVRAFDKGANGTVWGEGVGVVFLKPLNKAIADSDNIYAVIKGSAINNDGASNGITAPNPDAQARVILSAWKQAGIEPETISYIECHGTGTELGDSIEIKGLLKAFGKYTSKKQFCGIGSVKPNIGHTVAASGIASLFKVVFALKYRSIPKTINFSEASPLVDFSDSPIYVHDKMTEWKTGNEKRRAGVSAFGFSGTNCHVVLEEAPEFKNEIERESVFYVLALSAKKEKQLLELIENYRQLLNKPLKCNIMDLCYTTNTGKGHYNNRVAIVFNDYEELLQKIKKICDNSFELPEDCGIFYGQHKIVQPEAVNGKGQITELEKNEITKTALNKLNEYLSGNETDKELLKEICKLYVKGADILWKDFYKNKNCKKMSLPTYPFERVRCWVDHTALESTNLRTGNLNTKELDHPLLDSLISNSFEQDIYLTEFNTKKYWVLNEHIIAGKCTVPGVTFLEMARELGSKYYPNSCIELRDVVFLNLLTVEEDETKQVQTVIKKHKEFIEFNVISKKFPDKFGLNETWINHVTGKIYCNKENRTPQKYNLDDVFKKSEKVIPLRHFNIDMNIPQWEEGTNELLRVTVQGPRWRNLKRAYFFGKDEVIVEIELSKEFHSDLDDFFIHPALMDHGVNAAGFSMAEGMFLPFSYKKLIIYDRMPAKFYSHFKRNQNLKESNETVTFDITIFDETGNVFLEVRDYSIKRVHGSEKGIRKLVGNNSPYYSFEWIPTELNRKDANLSDKGTILIFKSCNTLVQTLVDKLRAIHGVNVIEVELGTAYEHKSPNKYIIGNSEEDYIKLMGDITLTNVSMVIHTFTLDTVEEDDIDALDRNLNIGVYSLFYFVKALVNNKITTNIQFILVSDYVNYISKQVNVKPSNATLFGLGRVIAMEYNNLKCKCIDIDKNIKVDDIINDVNFEINTYQVAYRDGKRYVEEFSILDIGDVPTKQVCIKQDGVYIITGGTGGIGLEISKHIAKNSKTNIILINRTKMPQRDEWERILVEDGSSMIAQKIKNIKRIEENGSKVFLYNADISDENDMKKLFDSISEKFNKIDGVINCAAVAGNGFIFTKDITVFRGVMAPKVAGTWLLNKYTSQYKLDFFIMFSSISSFLGVAGQGDYCAANSYLDAFTYYLRGQNKPALTINWPAWSEIGMAKDYGFAKEEMAFNSITIEQGMNMLDELLSSDFGRVIAAELNHKLVRLEDYNKNINLSEQIRHEIKRKQPKYDSGKTNVAGEKSLNSVKIRGRSDENYNEIESKIAQIWAKVMGIDDIDIYENFYNMGGDSILASQLMKEIDKHYPQAISITDIYAYPSVIQISEHIGNKMGISTRNPLKSEDRSNKNSRESIKELLDSFKSDETSIDNILDMLEKKGGEKSD